MSSYDGFSIEQMLHYLGKYSHEFHLTKIDDGWSLYVTIKEFGSFEMEGSMMQVIMAAFKRIKGKVLSDRKNIADKMIEIKM